MALTHLADTSVLTRVRHADIYGRLANLLEAGALARADISDLELGFTARDPQETLQDTISYLRQNFLGGGIFN